MVVRRLTTATVCLRVRARAMVFVKDDLQVIFEKRLFHSMMDVSCI
jgi:hypothetical protein